MSRTFLVIAELKNRVYFYIINDKSIKNIFYIKINNKNQELFNNKLISDIIKILLNSNLNIDYVKTKTTKSDKIYIDEFNQFKENFVNGIETKPMFAYGKDSDSLMRFSLVKKLLKIREEMTEKYKKEHELDR